jgi:hypothetical protein
VTAKMMESSKSPEDEAGAARERVARLRRAARRTALALAVLAGAFYFGFILSMMGR